MNDDELRRTFERLGAAVNTPTDARGRVAARIRQRRRRRASGYGVLGVAAVALAVGVLAVGGGDAGDPTEVATDPVTSEAAPRVVTCPGDEAPTRVDYDHAGYATFTALLEAEAADRGALAVDVAGRQIFLLRDDGTAHASVSWSRGAQDRWYPSSGAACADSGEWVDASSVPDGSAPLSLDVGHCWIEPVAFAGRTWDVSEEDQVGWGGGQPEGFLASGTAWEAGDVVTYVDDSGARLTLVPEGSPWTLERTYCD
ncbi:MAG: hypothetical protein Q8O61_05645 [Nocardioides sp.]|nr:hypothetical protein [Nocardioides sp.]